MNLGFEVVTGHPQRRTATRKTATDAVAFTEGYEAWGRRQQGLPTDNPYADPEKARSYNEGYQAARQGQPNPHAGDAASIQQGAEDDYRAQSPLGPDEDPNLIFGGSRRQAGSYPDFVPDEFRGETAEDALFTNDSGFEFLADVASIVFNTIDTNAIYRFNTEDYEVIYDSLRSGRTPVETADLLSALSGVASRKQAEYPDLIPGMGRSQYNAYERVNTPQGTAVLVPAGDVQSGDVLARSSDATVLDVGGGLMPDSPVRIRTETGSVRYERNELVAIVGGPSFQHSASRKQAYSKQDWNEVLVTYHNLTGQHLESNTVREQQARTILDQTGNPVQAVAAVAPQFSSMDVMMAHDRALQSMGTHKHAADIAERVQDAFEGIDRNSRCLVWEGDEIATSGRYDECTHWMMLALQRDPERQFHVTPETTGRKHAYDYPDAVGDPHSLPDRVNQSGAEPFDNPQGYNANPLRTENPARPEDTGLGRGETSMASLQHREARILEAMSRASHEERRVLAEQLNDLRREAAAARQADRDVDLAGAVIHDHLTPVLPHTLHTSSTDWLDGSPLPGATPDEAAREMAAQAALWFRKTHEAVIEDLDEFTEQARGQARKVGSAFGEHKDAAVDTFLREATRLRTAAGFQTTAGEVSYCEVCGEQIAKDGDTWEHSGPGMKTHDATPASDTESHVEGVSKQAVFEEERVFNIGGMEYLVEVRHRDAAVHGYEGYDYVIYNNSTDEVVVDNTNPLDSIEDAFDDAEMYLDDLQRMGRRASLRKGAPFAGYEDFDDCVSKNSDKDDPQAYCGRIKHETEGARKEAQGKHQRALDRLEREKTESAVWAAMEALDEYTMTLQTPEKQRLAEDAHDLIADLAMLAGDPDFEGLVQDRVDAARYVLRGRQGSRKQAYEDAYPTGHELQQFRDHSGDPIVIGRAYKVLGTSIEGEAVGVDTRHTNTSMMGSDGAVVLMRPDGSTFPSRGRVGGNFNLIPTGTTASKTAADNGWFVIDSVSGDAEGPFDSHDEAIATSMEQEIMDNIITEVRYGHEGRDGRFVDQTGTLSSRRTAEEKMTCDECGDSIAKDPDGSYHHTSGEKHDHEAKPAPGKEQSNGGDDSKESRRRTAAKEIPMWDVRPGDIVKSWGSSYVFKVDRVEERGHEKVLHGMLSGGSYGVEHAETWYAYNFGDGEEEEDLVEVVGGPRSASRKRGTGVGDEGDLSHDENADQVPATSDDPVLGDPDPQSGHGHSSQGEEGGEYRPNIDTEPFNPITWTQAAQAVQYLPKAEQPKLLAAISRHDHRTIARLVRMAEGVPEELKNSDEGAKDCTACDGKGTVPDEEGGVKDCEVCDGTGEAKSEDNGNGDSNGNGDKESARRRQAFRQRVQANLQRR